jgi:hypothetical protein
LEIIEPISSRPRQLSRHQRPASRAKENPRQHADAAQQDWSKSGEAGQQRRAKAQERLADCRANRGAICARRKRLKVTGAAMGPQ